MGYFTITGWLVGGNGMIRYIKHIKFDILLGMVIVKDNVKKHYFKRDLSDLKLFNMKDLITDYRIILDMEVLENGKKK